MSPWAGPGHAGLCVGWRWVGVAAVVGARPKLVGLWAAGGWWVGTHPETTIGLLLTPAVTHGNRAHTHTHTHTHTYIYFFQTFSIIAYLASFIRSPFDCFDN